jgi:hypothetical protein
MGHKPNADAGASFCHGSGGNQVFEYSKQHQIATSNICLDTNGVLGAVTLRYCLPGERSQQWDYDNKVTGFFLILFFPPCGVLIKKFTIYSLKLSAIAKHLLVLQYKN